MGASHGTKKPKHHIKWMPPVRQGDKSTGKTKKSKLKAPMDDLKIPIGIPIRCCPASQEVQQDLLDDEGFHILRRK